MNNNNRMLYSLILSVILIIVGVKLVKSPTAFLIKYTGFGMAFAGVGLLFLEFRQNQQSIIDSTLATIRMQTVAKPSPMPSGPMPSGPMPSGPMPSGPMPSGPMPSGPMPSGAPLRAQLRAPFRAQKKLSHQMNLLKIQELHFY
jgi:hypothetical protein